MFEKISIVSDDVRDEMCFQGQLLSKFSNSFIHDIPKNNIERELYKTLFLDVYQYNNGNPIKWEPPLNLRKGVVINEGVIDEKRDWVIDIFFEASPMPGYILDLTSVRMYLDFLFSQIIPFMASAYADYISETYGIGTALESIKEVFNEEARPIVDISMGVDNSVMVNYTIYAPSIRRCIRYG